MSKDNKNIHLRFYFPQKYKTNTKTPVIIFFHGGGFVMGNLDTHDYTCRSICIESEMVVVAVDYSLSPENKFPIALSEAKDVLQSLSVYSKELNLDLKNIFVCGSSILPENGFTNPTWTIMSLANRLSEYLEKLK